MRKFTLKNARGEEWDLNATKSFLSDPKGLGGERKTTYKPIGSTYAKTTDNIKQKAVSGTVVFSDYEEFEKFCRFVQHAPLVLIYTAADTYMMQVSIDKLTKTELDEMGLQSDITMKGLTTWYRAVYVEKMEVSDGKKYPYQYSYKYIDSQMGTITISSDSVAESPVRISILGPCKNPSWTHYINGQKAETGKIKGEISAGNRLVIDSTKIPYEIVEYDQNGKMVKDRYQDSDFATERFIRAGYGNNVISATHEGSEELKIAVEARLEYEFV